LPAASAFTHGVDLEGQMRTRLNLILAVAVVLLSWSETSVAQPLTLGSGKSVEILGVGPLLSAQGESALMLRYRTLLPLKDVSTLRKEVDEIWERFVVDAERGHYQMAFITANEPTKGFIITWGNSFGFAFEKKDGSWRTHESKERALAKLDPTFMREFVDRLDTAIEHNNMNALLLYMADDWTITSTNPGENAPAPQTMDRLKYAAITHATLAAATRHQHHREIISVSIAEGGTNGRVESREISEVTIKERHIAIVERQIAIVERSTDTFEMRGNVMLWTKSISVVEKQTETRSN
jgi:hypothetical protein